MSKVSDLGNTFNDGVEDILGELSEIVDPRVESILNGDVSSEITPCDLDTEEVTVEEGPIRLSKRGVYTIFSVIVLLCIGVTFYLAEKSKNKELISINITDNYKQLVALQCDNTAMDSLEDVLVKQLVAENMESEFYLEVYREGKSLVVSFVLVDNLGNDEKVGRDSKRLESVFNNLYEDLEEDISVDYCIVKGYSYGILDIIDKIPYSNFTYKDVFGDCLKYESVVYYNKYRYQII